MPSTLQLASLAAVVPAAQWSARLYGVPASVTLAQWITESSWGSSRLACAAHNYFGIKHDAKNNAEAYVEFPTREVVNGQSVMEPADFVRYVSAQDSFAAHARLLATAQRYRPAMKVAEFPDQFAEQLQACGYSTNPQYAAELQQLMRLYDLKQYDRLPPTEPAAQLQAA